MPKKKKVISGPRRRRGRPGINWRDMELCGPIAYPGTAQGAKANAWRANRFYAPKKYRSFQYDRKVFVERTQ